jgi:hypothetical protein
VVGDDLSLKADAHCGYDFGRPRQVAVFMLKNVGGAGRPLVEEVRESLRQSYERWDRKGAYQLRGEEVAPSARLMNLADVVEVFRPTRGLPAAMIVPGIVVAVRPAEAGLHQQGVEGRIKAAVDEVAAGLIGDKGGRCSRGAAGTAHSS